MRRVEGRGLFGERIPGLDTVTLTDGERATLARAAAILHGLRELVEDDDEDAATDAALAAYTCDDWAAQPRNP